MEKEPLFELIQSLSPAEKGYFKKTVQAGDDSNYIKLFDAINKQEKYDAEKLKKQFKGEKFMSNFSVTKQYLLDAILKSLRSYHAQNIKEFELDEYIQNIRVLYDKGQYELCDKMLVKAKQLAHDYELYTHLLRLLAFEHVFNQFRTKYDFELFEEERQALDSLSRTNRVNHAYITTLNWVQQHDRARNEEDVKKVEALREMEGFNLDTRKLSFQALNSYYAGETIYHYMLSADEKASDFKIMQLENYLQRPKLRETNTKNFLLVYGNVLTLLYNGKDAERFTHYYSLLKTYHDEIKEHEHTKLEHTIAFGMCYYNMTKNYAEGIAFAEEKLKQLEGREEKISRIRLKDYYLNAAMFCIYEQRFRQSLQWLLKVSNNASLYDNVYFKIPAGILELIVHYELGNEEIVIAKVKRLYRQLYHSINRHVFEDIMLRHLPLLLKADGKKEINTVLISLRNQLLELKKDPLNSRSMDHFDYTGWLAKKIS